MNLETLIELGSIIFFVGFVVCLYLGAWALDGGADTWLMQCGKCGKIYKAKTKGCNTVITTCVFCGNNENHKIKNCSKYRNIKK